MHEFPTLFSPMRVGPVIMRNRIETGPMSMTELDAKEGLTDQTIAFYENLAKGGAAVVTIGESIIRTTNGKTHTQMLMLGRPEVDHGLVRVADAIHAHGALANIEISHGGCMADPAYNNGAQSMGPVGFVDEWGDEIIGMDGEMMEDVAEAFAEAVEKVRDCGFDMAQIHCGHGWLLHQFLSPHYNTRTDEYGGSIENRAKFPIMVIDRVRARVGRSIALDMRISGCEFIEGGLDIGDVAAFCKMVEDKVDMINVSAGAPWTKRMAISIFEERGVNSAYSEAVKKLVTKIPVTSVGGYTDPALMEKYLVEGKADGFILGRSIVADPQLPNKARSGNADKIHQCLRCYVCNEALYHKPGRVLRCSINPTAGRELEEKRRGPAPERKKVLVAGGGPGGMVAAITAAGQGHDVVLYEKKEVLGGALDFAQHIPFKADLDNYAKTLAREVAEAKVKIHLGTALTPELALREDADIIISAIGAEPLIPPVKGLDGKNVVLGTEMFDEGVEIGLNVAVIGGGLVGCESALHLANEGFNVTIIEMREDVAIDSAPDHRRFMLPLLEEKVKFAVGMRVTEVVEDGVKAIDANGVEQLFKADTVILAAGLKARSDEAESLRSCAPSYRAIGDCLRAKKVCDAVRGGYDAAMNIS